MLIVRLFEHSEYIKNDSNGKLITYKNGIHIQLSFLTKIQNRICKKTRKKIVLLSCKKFVKTQFLGVVEFPSIFWIQFFKVVVFPSNFWKTTIIWQFFEWFWILPSGPWALKHYQSLGICKIYYSHFILEVMYHYLEKLNGRKFYYSQKLCFDKFFAWKEYNFPSGFLTNTILNFTQECLFPFN